MTMRTGTDNLINILFPAIALTALFLASWADADVAGFPVAGETVLAEAAQSRDDASPPAEGSGIRIKSLRTSAAGYMLDLRYEVTDPDRASKLLTRNVIPFLVHDRSGKVLAVPNMAKVGRLQQTNSPPEPGKVYFMMFDSGGKGLVLPGDTVTLVINDAFFEGLTVQ